MFPFWETVIRPFLAALDEGPVVEIGAAAGRTTEKLAEFAAERTLQAHSIDPDPGFDTEDLERRFPRSFSFHRERSHAALDGIGPAAAVLIDGDHNWYTVHRELELLRQIANSGERPFPLTLLHDVEWPYARRDMYYDPDTIPEEWRRPWARRGIKWGERRLAEDGGGINANLANALEEGGPKNGVLTAVEDFVAETPEPLELRIVRGAAGLGILVSPDLLAKHSALRHLWEDLHSPEFLHSEIDRLAEVAARQTGALLEARSREG